MCGIAGLFAKSPEIDARLGAHLAAMLGQLGDRGPDSSGVALYREPVAPGHSRVSLLAPDGPAADWQALTERLAARFGGAEITADHGSHAVLLVDGDPDDVQAWLTVEAAPTILLAAGTSIEVHKRIGRPEALIAGCALAEQSASHGLGHTRMATESRVTTAGAHPFSTGADLCLVHNGSLSNHNALRRDLIGRGMGFQTENDSEVAAGYLTWRLQEGDTLEQALEAALEDLDGFFTFAVGTHDGFAVLRDPIACKPAVMAETDDWVAMASEHRALAVLPGAEDAHIWEPEPGRVYAWSRAGMVA